MSVVPERAPGAESACGISGLLELARVLKKYPPARTVRLLATSGHFLGLAGMREYLGQPLPEFERYRQEQEWRGFVRLVKHSPSALFITIAVLVGLLAL